MNDYARGLRDGLMIVILARQVGNNSFATGLRDYPVCMTERGREGDAELDRLIKGIVV